MGLVKIVLFLYVVRGAIVFGVQSETHDAGMEAVSDELEADGSVLEMEIQAKKRRKKVMRREPKEEGLAEEISAVGSSGEADLVETAIPASLEEVKARSDTDGHEAEAILEQMSKHALLERATELGVDKEKLDQALDGDNTKSAFIELILAASQKGEDDEAVGSMFASGEADLAEAPSAQALTESKAGCVSPDREASRPCDIDESSDPGPEYRSNGDGETYARDSNGSSYRCKPCREYLVEGEDMVSYCTMAKLSPVRRRSFAGDAKDNCKQTCGLPCEEPLTETSSLTQSSSTESKVRWARKQPLPQ